MNIAILGFGTSAVGVYEIIDGSLNTETKMLCM